MEDTIVEVRNLKVWFPMKTGLFSKFYVHAVDGVSFAIQEGEIFSVVGESGSGKTTLGKAILGLVKPIKGQIYYRKQDIWSIPRNRVKILRRNMQMIFQDPFGSLNPKMNVFDTIVEPLRVHKLVSSQAEAQERVYQMLEQVGLSPPKDYAEKYPHELSGGQRQRVAIAAALILNPEFIVADEPTSMLDVSIGSQILNLMMDLKDKYNITYLFITHDLSLARMISNRIAVMYCGKIMEIGPASEVILNAQSPYTIALTAAVPRINSENRELPILLKSGLPNMASPPPGCRLHPRCPLARDVCRQKEPELIEVRKGHYVACHAVTEGWSFEPLYTQIKHRHRKSR